MAPNMPRSAMTMMPTEMEKVCGKRIHRTCNCHGLYNIFYTMHRYRYIMYQVNCISNIENESLAENNTKSQTNLHCLYVM